MDKSYRNLIREMAWSQFAVQDQNSVLGLIWSFLNPTLMVGVLFAYFQGSAGKGVAHYGIYLLLGMIHYTHFSNTTAAAMNSLHNMAQLTRHTVLPKEALVIGSVMVTSVEFGVSMLVCLILAFLSGVPMKSCLVAAPLIMLLQLVFATWVSFLLTTARVFVKDLSHLYQVFLRLLFFITPIFLCWGVFEQPTRAARAQIQSAGSVDRVFERRVP